MLSLPRGLLVALTIGLRIGSVQALTSNCSSQAIPHPTVFGANITSLTAFPITNYSGLGLDICQVNVTLTHPGTGDLVNNIVWLPLTSWNGRFQGTGGGGYLAGESIYGLLPAALAGYAAATTDAGHTEELDTVGNATSWALASNGNVNQYLLLDFASRSVHDMTVVGKAITKSFYGQQPKKSYWNGCSTGGRQGLVEAQMWPEDYDGILAEAPAVNWNPLNLAQQWSYVVLLNEPNTPEQCDFDFVNSQALALCDQLDGLLDGLIGAPGLCLQTFNPYSLVNQTYTCDATNATKTFQASTALIVQKIWNGPTNTAGKSLWYGLLPGSNFSSLANTSTIAPGVAIPLPFSISDSWISNFLYKITGYNTSNVTYAEFDRLWNQSALEYESVIGARNPDLSAFKAHGGKLITWQGLADQLIMPNGTIDYYDRVSSVVPNITDFYRLFFSPGVGHCRGGSGPVPTDALGALVQWVENGTAPATLLAARPQTGNGTVLQQALCPYPKVSKYGGKGGPGLAAAYECVDGF